jgi:hypothetical protein
MKSTTSALSAPFVLKVVGYVLLLFTLTEYASIFIPPKFSDDQWIGSALTLMVERGPIPLLGIAMIYVSSFLDSGSLRAEGRNPFMTGRFFCDRVSRSFGFGFLGDCADSICQNQ